MRESKVRVPRAFAPNPELLKPIKPVKLFDDLFFVGHTMCGSWIIKTSEGLVLIEASAEVDFWERFLQPGLKELGLENEKILGLLLTHGHMDHYAGAAHIQDATNCDIYLSMADTAYMISGVENIPANKGADPTSWETNPIPIPAVTKIIKDKDDLVFGDHTVHCLLAPGHTPGCLNYSTEVHEGDETHRFVMMGGYGVFGPGSFMGKPYPYGTLYSQEYALRFAYTCVQLWEYAKENNVDIFLNPHPHLCGMHEAAAANQNRKPGDPNALVIGLEGVREWIAERYYACLNGASQFTDLTLEIE